MIGLAALLLPALLAQAPQGQAPAAAAAAPHVEWQRTLADALAVQEATGLPLLIAVNMDGEVFNERFAKTTYRDPAFIASTRGWVCVVASPDRHTERDYDAAGNRIECPRFGGCTCSEHIAIEPELFRRFFNGTRNAPRHVGVGRDGKILFDRFLDQSMQTAIDAIAQHRGDAAKQPGPSDDFAALFARRDALARRTIELAWRQGDATQRRKLLDAAATAKVEPTDLLRAALREEDPALFAHGALALARHAGKGSVGELEDALARCTDAAVQQALVARAAELGKEDAAAARLAAHFEPGDAAALRVVRPWSNPWAPARFDAEDRDAVEKELDRCEAALKKNAADDAARLDLAIAQVLLADILVRDGQKNPQLWYADAIATAKKVQDAARHAEVQAVIAWAATMSGESELSGKALVQAQTLVNSPRQPAALLAVRACEVIVRGIAAGMFADPETARGRSQRAEIDRVRAVLALLRERQAPREGTMLAGAAVLEFGGLRAEARAVLAEAAVHFPGSVTVHERWRNRLRGDLGAEGMRKAYAAWVAASSDKPTAEWFAGLAALHAGEQHTTDQRTDLALAAYGEAIERFERSAAGNADYADAAHHYAVLALAGRAELALARGQHEAAVADLVRAAALRPASLDESDGLQRKPRAIAGRVAAALAAAGKAELATQLKPLLD